MMSRYYLRDGLPTPVSPVCTPPRTLEGQVAVVTGASSGLGAAIARALGAAGADVVVDWVASEPEAEAVAEDVRASGSRALAVRADVSEEAEVQALFRRAIDAFGTVDILVNNAGIQRDAAIDEMTLAQWRRVLDVNLTGQFLCAREAVREFKRRGVVPEVSCAAGKIVFISSVHEFIPWAGHANYAASKGGVMMLMKSVAQEVAGHRIRVNGVAPGAIRTHINTPAWETPEAYRRLMELVPYNRIGEPDDVGRAVAWLVSDHADYVVGTTLVVDGGMALYPGFTENG